jgi:hypothetical protein
MMMTMMTMTTAKMTTTLCGKDGVHGPYQSFGLTKRIDVHHSDSASAVHRSAK